MEQPQVQPATTSAVAVQSDFRRLRNVKVGNVVGQTSQERRVNCVIDKHSLELLEDKRQGVSSVDVSQLASDKNQVMDELLNQDQIPADYGTQMVALFRDKGQDVLMRDFAVQHIGLYAQALNRRGVYDPESADSRSLRVALASRVMAVHLCGEHRVAAAIISSVPPQNNERKENKGVSRECV